MKTHPLLARTLTLALIGLLLWIPLMISAKINERSALQRQVEREIESTAFGPQRALGPFIALECREDYVQDVVSSGAHGDTVRHERKSRARPTHCVFPDSLTIDGDVPTQTGARGIHRVRVFEALSSEDYALLLGSVLAFAALTAVMVATRRLDWFAWSRSFAAASSGAP